jgi:CheY-like chemotaxis protein
MPFDIPVVSCWVPGSQEAVDEIGVQDYLVKPIHQSDLLEAIDRVAPNACSILLADDDPDARQLFGRLLTALNPDYSILDAEDGEEALKVLRERLPDLLLLDLVMPNQDGFAVMEEKARDERIRDIPTIIVSGKDLQQSPIVSKQFTVTRQGGLSARDLVLSMQSIVRVLRPRFGAPVHSEMSAELQACE